MDRDTTRASISSLPVPTHRDSQSKLLLRTCAARRVRAIAHEESRRDLHCMALLRLKEDSDRVAERRAYGQQETGAGAYEENGISRHPSWAQYFSQKPRAQGVSISTEGSSYYEAVESMEHRHHIHQIAEWIRVSGGYHRLVQQNGAVIPPFEQPRGNVLLGGFRRGIEGAWDARDLQHGSRCAIHLYRVRGSNHNARDPV